MHPGNLAGLSGFLPDHLLRNGILHHPAPAGMTTAALHSDVRAVRELGKMGGRRRAAGLCLARRPMCFGMASAAVHSRLVGMSKSRRARMAGGACLLGVRGTPVGRFIDYRREFGRDRLHFGSLVSMAVEAEFRDLSGGAGVVGLHQVAAQAFLLRDRALGQHLPQFVTRPTLPAKAFLQINAPRPVVLRLDVGVGVVTGQAVLEPRRVDLLHLAVPVDVEILENGAVALAALSGASRLREGRLDLARIRMHLRFDNVVVALRAGELLGVRRDVKFGRVEQPRVPGRGAQRGRKPGNYEDVRY